MAIKRHSHFPRPRKYFRVLDGGFVIDGVGARGSVAFDYMQGVTMEVPRPVEPCLIVKTSDVDNERIALPMADRPAHPRIIGTLQLAIHIDGSSGTRELIGHEDVFGSLKDLKRIRHVCGARHARHITLDFGV